MKNSNCLKENNFRKFVFEIAQNWTTVAILFPSVPHQMNKLSLRCRKMDSYYELVFALGISSFHWLNGVFPKCVHWIRWIQWQNICHYSKRARTSQSATKSVRDQDTSTAPARQMWETGSLNQAQFMLQSWSVSLNSLNSVKVLLNLGKMSQGLLGLCCLIETRDRIERFTLTAVLFD